MENGSPAGIAGSRERNRRSLLGRISQSLSLPAIPGLRSLSASAASFYHSVSTGWQRESLDEEFFDGQSLPESRRDELLAGRYKLVEELGCGGMGRVYRAQDFDLGDEIIAVKILHPQFARDPRFRSRFIREVRLMRTITTIHVVRTFDVGMCGDELFLTMEFVDGVPLAKLICENEMKFQEKLRIAREICAGLVSVHEKNIIHRDIKPANILVDRSGEVKIADFGLARPLTSELTMANEIMGSLCYVAPEMVMGQHPSLAVDLYSLGVVLYELFTGRVPFDTPSFYALMRMHVEEPPIAPREIAPNLPESLSLLMMQLLEKDPALRPNSAADVLHVLSVL